MGEIAVRMPQGSAEEEALHVITVLTELAKHCDQVAPAVVADQVADARTLQWLTETADRVSRWASALEAACGNRLRQEPAP